MVDVFLFYSLLYQGINEAE